MLLEELIQSNPEQVSQKLAAYAILNQRLGLVKTAGLAETAAAVKDHIVKGLSSGNPAYTGAAGALGLGGLSAIRESFKPKEERRAGNVLTAAGIGGAMGAGLPMIGNLSAALPPAESEMAPSALGNLSSAVSDGVSQSRPGALTGAGIAATTATVEPSVGSGFNSLCIASYPTPPTPTNKTMAFISVTSMVVLLYP